MIAVSSSTIPRLVLRVALVVFGIFALGALLLISLSPTVHVESRPNPADVHAAREAWVQLNPSQKSESATRLRLDNRMIRGLTVLGSDATGNAIFDARVAEGELSAETSISLPAGLWVNVTAATRGEHSGFPPIRLKVGRLSLPSATGRWFIGAGRTFLQLKGANIPPLDEIIRYIRIDQNEVIAELALPRDKVVVVLGMLSGSDRRLNNQLVSDIYCQLMDSQMTNPSFELDELVRRTFTQVPLDGREDYSRAAFVALSFLVIGDSAETIAPKAADLSRKCRRTHRPILLHQREDLAKHWALSAALGVVLGEQAATSLGEWKELNDSLPKGSGFSFVDIAANRAGLQTGLRALDPASTQRAVEKLGQATEEGLMPKVLLSAPEGLSEIQFRDRFGRLDQKKYGQAIASIDQLLAKNKGEGE